MITDGLWDAYEDFHMGMTGELVAEKYGITRQEQDHFAVESHRRSRRTPSSRASSKRQIVPIEIPQKKGRSASSFETDESPRADTSLEALAKLKPAFKKDGTVTAGNAPGTNDGAAALIVTSERNARALGKKPMARIVAQAVSGVEPKWVMMAPVDAVEKLLQENRLGSRQRCRPGRAERSLRRGSHRRNAPTQTQSRKGKRERRRRRHRPSHRRIRRAHPRHAALRNGAPQSKTRHRRPLPRRRQRRSASRRTLLALHHPCNHLLS